MRVIGGELKGRRITAPELATLRPTSDRVKESMFDVLDARGLVEEARVLDLFAGSGALGIEALSRGAAHVTFVERDARAVRAIEKNLESLGYPTSASGGQPSAQVKVARADAETWLEVHGRTAVDLVLADPPYDWDGWPLLLSRCTASHMLLEHRGPVEVTAPYEVSRQYRYGSTLVTLVRDGRHGAAPVVEPDSSDKDSL